MSISRVDHTKADFSAAATNPKVITMPNTPVAGDLAFLFVTTGAVANEPDIPPSMPNGNFTQVPSMEGADTIQGNTYYRWLVTGDAGAGVSIHQATTSRVKAMIVIYRGVDPSSPFGQQNTASETATDNSHNTGSITTTVDGWIVKVIHIKDDVTTPSGDIQADPAYTLVESSPGNTFTSTAQMAMAVADSNASLTPGTYSGPFTVFDSPGGPANNSINAIGFTLQLIPAATSTEVRPISDITVGTGISFVGAASGFDCVDDNDPATYLEWASGASRTYEGKLAAPGSAPTQIEIKYYTAGGAVSCSVQTILIQGTTTIASFGPDASIPTGEVTRTYTVSAGQQASISNLNDLRIRVVGNVS